MSRREVVAEWTEGWQVKVQAGEHTLLVDEPLDVGGTDTGPRPTQYLLAGLASCFALSLAWAARKRGIELPGLRVECGGSYRNARFEEIEVRVRSAVPEVVEELIPAAAKVCHVSRTLDVSPTIAFISDSLSDED